MPQEKEIKHKSFLLYKDKKALIEGCTDEQAGQLFKAIYEYACTGKKRTIENRLLEGIFQTFADGIDSNEIAYQQKCLKNRENGKKGGRPKKNSTFVTNGKKGVKSNAFNDFQQNDYDFDSLEQDLQ